MSWREHAAAALRSAGPTKHEKQAALKRAGEEWRMMRGRQSNPSGNLMKLALLAGAAFVGLKVVLPALQQKPGAFTYTSNLSLEANANAPYIPYPQWTSD